LAETEIVPETVAFAAGAVMDTDGGVVSAVRVVAATGVDGVETFPAASKAATVYE